MTPSAFLVLGEEFLLMHDGRLHFHGGLHRALTSPDRAVVESLMSGACELEAMSAGLVERIGGGKAQIAAKLEEEASSGTSLLNLVHLPPLEVPEIVLIDCCSNSTVDTTSLAHRLRRQKRVLHAGLEARVTGAPGQRLAIGESWRGRTPDPFEFLQVLRGLVRSLSDVTLVLCSEVDAILFGDLTAYQPSVVFLDQGWPGAVMIADALETQLVATHDMLARLFYGMRCIPVKDWHNFSRRTNLGFASLEALALKNARAILSTCQDQVASLAARRGEGVASLVSFQSLTAPDPPMSRLDDCIAVLADVERDWIGLTGLIRALGSALQETARPVHTFFLSHGKWHHLSPKGPGIVIEPCAAAPGEIGQFPAVIAVPGMLRNAQPALTAMASAVPTYFAPTRRRLELMAHVPESNKLGQLTPDELRRRVLVGALDRGATHRQAHDMSPFDPVPRILSLAGPPRSELDDA